jgi:hypothetical protein
MLQIWPWIPSVCSWWYCALAGHELLGLLLEKLVLVSLVVMVVEVGAPTLSK